MNWSWYFLPALPWCWLQQFRLWCCPVKKCGQCCSTRYCSNSGVGEAIPWKFESGITFVFPFEVGKLRRIRKRRFSVCQGSKKWLRRHTHFSTTLWLSKITTEEESSKKTLSVHEKAPSTLQLQEHWTGSSRTARGAWPLRSWSTTLAETYPQFQREEHKHKRKLSSWASGIRSALLTSVFSGSLRTLHYFVILFLLSEDELDEAFCRDIESFSPAFTPRVRIQG